MGVDIKSVLQENQKLLLSLFGAIVLVLLISSTGASEVGFFGFWNLDPNTTRNISKIVPGGNSENAINTGDNNKYKSQPTTVLKQNTDYTAKIITSMGEIQVDLYEELTPKTVNNFVFLAQDDFYQGISIHRVAKNFVIQGGDPLGTGTGSPGYTFPDEIVPTLTFKPFVLAMANSGPNTNGSQFFITTRFSNTASLNGKYTIFGQVTSGYDVVDKIELVETNSDEMPLQPIIIQNILIQERSSL
jgi:cyclophilin family peptidyl-prolyl cis-trans isomerase